MRDWKLTVGGVVLISAFLAWTAHSGGAWKASRVANSVADCAFTRPVTDPVTGITYTVPVNNPTECPGDRGTPDPFIPVARDGGRWAFPRPSTVEPGFAALPRRLASCAPIIMYSVRGTRENFNTDRAVEGQPRFWSRHGLASDRGLGMTGFALLERLRAVEPAGAVDGYSAYYPVAPTSFGINLVNAGTVAQVYRASVAAGVAETVRELNQIHADCPGSRVLLTGFSQGADVIRRALASPGLSPSISGPRLLVILFGDPNFDPREANVPGAPSHDPARAGVLLNGSFDPGRTGLGDLLEPVIPVPPPLPARFTVASWCHAKDVVCQGEGDSGPHSSYSRQDMDAAAYLAAYHFATTGGPAPTAAVPVAFPVDARCLGDPAGTTEVRIRLASAGAGAVDVAGSVGVAAGGAVTPVGDAFASPTGVTWTQRLPVGHGPRRFLFQVTQAGVPNRSATGPDGRHPDVLLYTAFHDHQCP
ncbi:cutinase family protein [Actinomycetes bacterium KLBMP 9797]